MCYDLIIYISPIWANLLHIDPTELFKKEKHGICASNDFYKGQGTAKCIVSVESATSCDLDLVKCIKNSWDKDFEKI